MSHGLPPEDCCPKRFGLNYDPPAIVLEYLQLSTQKLFHRRIVFRRLKPSSDAIRIAERVRQKNEQLLSEDKVSFEQLVSLVRKLQEAVARGGADAAPAPPRLDYHKVDLNKVSDEELIQHKSAMDIDFQKNMIRPGDPDYQYDIEVEFGDGVMDSGWDSDGDVSGGS
eukprot:NODE_12609_length_1214_cov_3.182153.p1 GENE.NODE_12609_length_1214_cov_3.182153~~NODE_12609_length_1214_cov_3.182153.p1  ORF type:complete len:168 (-),score=28.68 NODE_12609_length_1214_cov_3.182153:537-1040(-)